MDPDIWRTVVTALSSGGFALAGVAFGDRRAVRRERDAYRRDTLEAMAEVSPLVWGGEWVQLEAALQRMDGRLRAARVPGEMVAAWADACRWCWRDYQQHVDDSAGEEAGIRSDRLDYMRVAHGAIAADLLGEADAAEQRARLMAYGENEAAAASWG